MNEILLSIVAFVVSIGLLITFHEFGHFWVARFFDVKVLRFSIGFGRSIFTKVFGKDSTEFTVGLFPLGGYVKMLDDREGEIKDEERDREFNGKPVWQRFCIVIAGPIFNFIFAIIAYSIVYSVGINALKPIVGNVEPSSISAKSGFEQGQQILAVNDKTTPTWVTVHDAFIANVISRNIVSINVIDTNGIKQTLDLDLSSISIDEMVDGKLLNKIGLAVVKFKLPPVIGNVQKNSPAEKMDC